MNTRKILVTMFIVIACLTSVDFGAAKDITLALEGQYDTTGNAIGVTVIDNYAYVADHANGLVIVDISNSKAPALIGSYDTAGGAEDVAISGSYALHC